MSRSLASFVRLTLMGSLVLSCSSNSSNFSSDGGGTASGVPPGGLDPVMGGGRRAGNDPGTGVSGTDPLGAGGRVGAGGSGGNASGGAGGQLIGPGGAGGGIGVRLDGGASSGGSGGSGAMDMAGPPRLDMAGLPPKTDAPQTDSVMGVDANAVIDQAAIDGPGMCGSGTACGDLETQYEAAFKKAQVCLISALNQCEARAPSTLGCPTCESWVNSKDELASIRAKWEDMSCGKCHRFCPLIRCLQITEGTCGQGSASGRTGVCADKKPVLSPL